jgi:hypothetical protein
MAGSHARYRQHVVLRSDCNRHDLLSAADVLLAADGQLHAADMLSNGLSAGAGYGLSPYDYLRPMHRLSAHCNEAGHVVCHAGAYGAVYFLPTRSHCQLCAVERHVLLSGRHDRGIPGRARLLGSLICMQIHQSVAVEPAGMGIVAS